MALLLPLLLLAAAQTPAPVDSGLGAPLEQAIGSWARCAADQALVAIRTRNPKTTAVIVDEALTACDADERRLRVQYLARFGAEGPGLFDDLRRTHRERMIVAIGEARTQRGT